MPMIWRMGLRWPTIMAVAAMLLTAGCPLLRAEAQRRSPEAADPPRVHLPLGPTHRNLGSEAGRVPETADPGKAERDEPGGVTEHAIGAAVIAIAAEAVDIGRTLLAEGELRDRLPRLRQQWEHLQPRLAPECMSTIRTTSISPLIGAAAAADEAEREARAAEGRMAALTVQFGMLGQWPAPVAGRSERGAVEPRRDNLDAARRDLHAAWRSLRQAREVLAGALAEAGSVHSAFRQPTRSRCEAEAAPQGPPRHSREDVPRWCGADQKACVSGRPSLGDPDGVMSDTSRKSWGRTTAPWSWRSAASGRCRSSA